MKLKMYVIFSVIAILAVLLFAINYNKNKNEIDKTKKVVTTFYPVYIATLNITDSIRDIDVTNLTSNVTTCLHDYSLSTSQMAQVADSNLLIMNGAGMEPFIDNITKSYPKLNIVDTSKNTNILENNEQQEAHEKLTEEQHEHEQNSHIYLDISNYKIQVENIYRSIINIDVSNSKSYKENKDAYIKKLNLLQNKYNELKNKISGIKVVIYNQAIQYIANSLELDVVVNLEIDHESGISSAGVIKAINNIKQEDIKYILVPKDYDKKVVNNIIKGLDVKIVKLNLLTYGENNKDAYINMMQENLQNIQASIVK